MRYQRAKDVAWRRVGEETVIVHLARRRMLAVNEAGGAVWEVLAGGGVVAAGERGSFLSDLEAEGVVERLAAEGRGAEVRVAATAAVLWREELHRFGGCGFVPDQSPLCDQNPYSS